MPYQSSASDRQLCLRLVMSEEAHFASQRCPCFERSLRILELSLGDRPGIPSRPL